MRTKGLDQKPVGAEIVAEAVPATIEQAVPAGAGETPAEVRDFQKKNAGAASRTTQDAPTGGDAAIAFFTARTSYQSHLLSQPVRKELAGALGPEAIPFFELYYQLETLARDPHAPRPRFREMKENLDSALAGLGHLDVGSKTLNEIWSERRGEDGGTGFEEILQKACRKSGKPTKSEWRMLSEFFQYGISELAREKNVYVTLGREGSEDWPSFRLMSGREQELEKLRTDDPIAYALIDERTSFYRDRDASIQRAIRRLPLEEGEAVASRKASIRRRVVTVADVLRDGAIQRSFIFDVDAKPRTFDDYISWRDRFAAAKDEVTRDDGLGRAQRVLTDFQLSSLRVLDDAALPLLPGPIEMHGLADETSTRSVATKMFEGQRVVVEGRYAGIPLEALVDRTGRLIESVIEEPGRHEPYIWYDETKQKLVLDFPNKQGEWTAIRTALRDLAKQEEGIAYERVDRRQPRFTFPVELYDEIERIISFSRRTSGANQIINAHYAEQARLEAATRPEEQVRFSAARIGGFQPGVELRGYQKEALAYLEARGGRGVINLDTGDGKTLVAISQMLLAARNGQLDRPGSNGRFLFVCNGDHRGNLRDEIEKFCDPEAKQLLLTALHEHGGVRRRGRVDVMSYPEFLHASKSGTWKGKPWSPHQYATGFFDEVHKKLEHPSATASAICAMQAPKVLLTASLVGKNPAQALKLRYVADGVDLYAPESESIRREINKVSRHLSVRVGPYDVGINPSRKLRAKQIFEGIFHRKRVELPTELVLREEPLTMQPAVQDAYRTVLDSHPDLRPALQSAACLWRDAGERPKGVEIADPKDPRIGSLNAINTELKAKHDLLIDLENRPNHFALDGERLIDLTLPGAPSLAPLLDYNPKLRAAAERFADKLDGSPQSRAALMIDDKRLVEEAALEMLKADVPGGHAACLPDQIVVYRHATEKVYANALAEAEKLGKSFELTTMMVNGQPVVKLVYRSTGKDFQTEMLKTLQEMMRSLAEDTSIRTLSLYRPTYSHGHNIQKGLIDTVIDPTPPKGHQASHQSLSRFWRQGTEVESVEHVSVVMRLDREDERFIGYDLLPGEIQRHRNAREKSIYEDSVAAVDDQGHYSGLPPETRSTLIQSRRIFQLERDIASGDLKL